MGAIIQHRFNALHLYCLLMRWGVNKRAAAKLCRKLEKFIKLLIY